MSYDEGRFMTVRTNDECYDDIHGIVCLNMSVLYTSLHLGMENNVVEESFHFSYTKKSFLGTQLSISSEIQQ